MTPFAHLRRVGERALLVECDAAADPQTIVAAARNRWPATLEEAVGGDRTALLSWSVRPPDRAEVLTLVEEALRADSAPPTAPVVCVEVRYDGADLEEVAARLGSDVDGVIALHTGSELRVRFVGTGGFPYLVGGSLKLWLPRRAKPRIRVPGGAVAIAAGYTGIYPTSAPGGWWILGRTESPLFDVNRDPPAALQPGARVRLRALG